MRGPIALSDAYESTYDRLLADLAHNSLGTERMAVFWPMCGERFDGDLLVVGRATRTWYRPVQRAELLETKTRAAVLREKRVLAEGDVNTRNQRWVVKGWGHGGEFDLRRSQFWRVVRRVTLATDPSRSDSWPLHICYSNLFKVAMEHGNPSARLRNLQLPLAAQLLQGELAEYTPGRVLVLAGQDWFRPFAATLGVKLSETQGCQHVECAGTDGRRRWVIAPHPMTRPEEPLVEEILRVFERGVATRS
jgi:hypothetical protein